MTDHGPTAEEFADLPYTRAIIPDGDGYSATVLEFPGCVAQGDTPDEIITAINRAAASWIAAALSCGQTIPEPAKTINWIVKIRDYANCNAKFLIDNIPRITDPALIDALKEIESDHEPTAEEFWRAWIAYRDMFSGGHIDTGTTTEVELGLATYVCTITHEKYFLERLEGRERKYESDDIGDLTRWLREQVEAKEAKCQ